MQTKFTTTITLQNDTNSKMQSICI